MSKRDPWWKSAVLYQVYPRSFSDSTGTGTGDLRGIYERLPYIASSGIDAIWISPFFKSPMKDFGYDVEDHRQVDPLFGTNEDFDALLERAHDLGIRVLIDLVLSHCASTHVWFQDCLKGRGSPYDNAFVWAEPAPNGGPPNNWLSVFGGPAWSYNETREQYYLHNFLESQPDFNFHNPVVREEAFSIVRYWLEKGVDGFRIDAVNFCLHDPALRDNPPTTNPDVTSVQRNNPYGSWLHLYDKNHPDTPKLLEDLRTVMDDYEERVTIGEIGASQEESQMLMREYSRPGRLNLCYSFDLLSSEFDAQHFRGVFDRLEVNQDDTWMCWSFSNHDVARAATRLSSSSATPDTIARISLALLVSFRGTPCVYQGEELGLEEAEIPFEQIVDPYGIAFYPEFKGRDGCRTPMPWVDSLVHGEFCPEDVTPWLPIPEHQRNKAVNRAMEDPGSVYHGLVDLLSFRKKHLSLCLGKMRMLNSDPGLLLFERRHESEITQCAFNLSSDAIEVDRPKGWNESPGRNQGVSMALTESRLIMPPWSWYIQSSRNLEHAIERAD